MTAPGEKLLDAYKDADALKFGTRVACAGPFWSLAIHGLPFSGQEDAFVRKEGALLALKEVQAPEYVLEDLGTKNGIKVPSPENLVIWLLETMDERFVLAAPFLAKTAVGSWDRLWKLATRRGVQGRLAYVLWATDQGDRIPPDLKLSRKPEPLVSFANPGASPGSAPFHVTHVVPRTRFEEFARLYRGRRN